MALEELDGSERRRAEVDRRLDQMRELLDSRGMRACLLRMRRNFAWLTAGGQNHVVLATEEGVAPLLVTADQVVVLAPKNESARIADEEVRGLEFEVAELDWFEIGADVNEARRRVGTEVAEDADLEDDLMVLRSRLTALDHDRLRWLGRSVRQALASASSAIEPTTHEDDVAAMLQASMAAVSTRSPVVLVAADERIERYRHPLPTDATIRRRVMMVLVAERWGLHAAATRIVELEPLTGELARRTVAVGDVLDRMREATRPGASLGDVFGAAQAGYAEWGFPDEWRLHHQGGTIGYAPRERIAIPDDLTPIEPGMAFGWNPSITGAKVEETFILRPDGSHESLTG